MGRHRESIDFFLTDPAVGMSYLQVLSRSIGKEGNQKVENIFPSAIRTVYTTLMRTLFIDREPLEYNVSTQAILTAALLPSRPLTDRSRTCTCMVADPRPDEPDHAATR